jgi:hypothetical protein
MQFSSVCENRWVESWYRSGLLEGREKSKNGVFEMTGELIRGAENRAFRARTDECAGRISVYAHRVERGIVDVPQALWPTGGGA